MDRKKINQFLATKTHKKFMELGGIDYFIKRWETTCDEIPYGIDYYMIDEHLNDLRFRFKIDEVLENFSLPEDLSVRLRIADEIFKSKSTSIERCVFSANIEKKKNISKEKNWYYYYLPTSRIDEWLPILP
jgi:hypothetical protein